MRYSAVVLAALSATAAAGRVGHAIVSNHCDFPVYLWSVGGSVSDKGRIKPGGRYVETYERDPVTGGRALKITRKENGLYNGAPQTNFAYTLDPGKIWYDLSDVFGSPFEGCKLEVIPSDKQCGRIVWENGVQPAGSQVKVCSNRADVKLTLCA